MEIVDTDNAGYRRELRHEREVLESALAKLDGAAVRSADRDAEGRLATDAIGRFAGAAEAQRFLAFCDEAVRRRAGRKKLFGKRETLPGVGLYLDGGFGVGKTHLLASAYRRLPDSAEHPKAFATFGELTQLASVFGFVECIDLLADGTFHLIDYKTRAVPDPKRALQLPIYSVCVEQRLDGYRGRHWTLGDASYLSYEGTEPLVGLVKKSEELRGRLGEAQGQMLDVLDGIAAGHFPPQPAERSLCNYCAFASVCRKDYVSDEPAVPAAVDSAATAGLQKLICGPSSSAITGPVAERITRMWRPPGAR